MLQDRYGRLTIIVAFVIIGVILMMAPGMNSDKVSSNSHNSAVTTQESSTASTNNGSATANSGMNNYEASSSTEGSSTLVSPERQMLDSWGMSESVTQSEPEAEASPEVSVPVAAPDYETETRENITKTEVEGTSSLESHTSSAEEAAPAEPKKILRVGEKCFAAPKKTVFMLNTECSKVATLFGLHACPLKDVKDEWAGAVRTCGGIGRMPTMDDLLALARVLYSSNSIAISEKDKVQIKAYGKFSEKPSGTDNMSFNDLIYVPDIAQKLYMPEASEEGFSIWGNTEISPEYALAVTYGKNAVKYNSATLRTSENFYTMCQVSCE